MIQGIFAAQVGQAGRAAHLMTSVNESLIRRALQSRFATVFYGTLSSTGLLTYANAGHNPPVLLTRNGVRRLETGGLILGLFAQATYEQEAVQLEPGDVLVVFSDGVTEALNAEGGEFGEQRLLAPRRKLHLHAEGAPRPAPLGREQLRRRRRTARRRDRALRAALRDALTAVEPEKHDGSPAQISLS